MTRDPREIASDLATYCAHTTTGTTSAPGVHTGATVSHVCVPSSLAGDARDVLRAQADEIDRMRAVFHAIYLDVASARWNFARRLGFIVQAAREFSPEAPSFREARGILGRRDDISPEHSIRASRDARP